MIKSINPADGSTAGAVVRATEEDVDEAVHIAEESFRTESWRHLRPDQRAMVLYEISRRLIDQRDLLARLQMLDSGKPIRECKQMVVNAAEYFRYYAALAETWQNELTSPRGEYLSMSLAEPFGVVAAITPWNSPIMLEAQKVAPALAVGNAVLLKPSEETPLLSLELCRIATESGLPDGMLTALPGFGSDVGSALVKHRGVRMISFTGGTETGRIIGAEAGRRLIPAALELGGKSPHIVFEDADLDRAAASVVTGIFGSAGQSCIAGSRLFVQRSIHKAFLKRVLELTREIRVGMPAFESTQVGPLISQRHRERVEGFVVGAVSEGGDLLCGGVTPQATDLKDGFFFSPTVVDGLLSSARACQEEIFGPVLVCLPFDDEDDLVDQANGTAFGLAAGIWTSDFVRAWRIARELEAGSVWINTYKQSHIPTAFGGFKDSGIGRQKGFHGLRMYSQVKSIYFGLQTKHQEI